MLRYADHHIFHSEDLADIKKHYEKISNTNKIILTTEKDAVRLVKFEEQLKDFPVYVLPIEHHFLFDESKAFDKLALNFIASFAPNP
ncbi:MAG: tetraacyldisaccharide 4'-kinase [Ferruginibacter sp.]